ncbi:putative F-box protein At1g19160 [Papaver somniferum]|uniref:putative F-box protein At1g19160 n=1 Tax=Papaver somniferum TaxID=3469 RepID=UPI000E702D99|nr:putative F-box protein At1g19160 [Papaver somniferum]
MEYFKSLPDDITLEILTRLPAESVLESKLVCKNWRSLVSHHPLFSRMHLQYVNHPSDPGNLGFLVRDHDFDDLDQVQGLTLWYLDYNDKLESKPVQRITRFNFTPPPRHFWVVGSVHGLICLGRGPSFLICNPITREYVLLPEIKRDQDEGIDIDFSCMSGFCYVSSTNEYKVIRIDADMNPSIVHIYTLGSGNGWRKLGNNFSSEWCHFHWNDAALYWLDDELKMIGTFDFVEEKFGEFISPPPLPPDSEWFCCHLGVLDGSLYFIGNVDLIEDDIHDSWLFKPKNNDNAMKKGDGHRALGWSQEFKVEKTRLLEVAKSCGAFNLYWYHLSSYNIKASTSKMLVDFKQRNCKLIPHKNTLVSLKEFGELDTKTMETVERHKEP